jgi:hypothetical protein
MPDYYDTIYRQILRELHSKHTRPYDPKKEKICEFSWAILARECYVSGTGLAKRIEYEVVEDKGIFCGLNQVKQQTDFIKVEVDVYKLSDSYYLLEQADRLTFQLCNAKLYDFIY